MELEEFDFKSGEEIFRTQRAVLARHKDLLASGYEPIRFRQMIENRPWWGIEGIYFYGPRRRAIAGPSEESRLISNLILLVGLVETSAYLTEFEASDYDSYYPNPLRL